MDKKIKGIYSEKIILYLLVLSFLSGELTGSVLSCIVDIDKINGIVDNFLCNRFYCTFIQTVINSFTSTFIFIILCAVLGMGAFFQLFEAVVPFFYGLGTGMVFTEMNRSYGFKGLLYSAMMIVPYTLISAITVIIASREALIMSNALAENILINHPVERKFDLNLYLTKFLLLVIITAVASVADGIVTYFFTEFWADLLDINIYSR